MIPKWYDKLLVTHEKTAYAVGIGAVFVLCTVITLVLFIAFPTVFH